MPALDPKSLLALVVTDEEVAAHIPASAHIRVFTHASGSVLDKFSKIFVSVPLAGLSAVSGFVKEANERHYLRSFLVRDADSSNLLPQYLYRANMRSLRNLIVHADFQVPGRVLKAHVLAAEHDLIADARLVGDHLVVISCAGEIYELPLEETRTLAGSSSERLHSFRVEEDGSYVYWPTLDLHLDLRAIQERLNPEIKEQSRIERLQSDQLFGRAVAEFRRRCHLKQADISGLSARQVSRIEHGEPTKVSSLKVLARAHKMPFNDYLNALAEVIQELKSGS